MKTLAAAFSLPLIALLAAYTPAAAEEQVLADFESLDNISGLKLDMNNARRGKYSGLWEDTVAIDRISIKGIPPDFSAGKGLRLYIESTTATGATIALVLKSENETVEGSDYYQYHIVIDWEGWREIDVPFADMAIKREPLGLQAIEEIRFASTGFGIGTATPGTRLKFDDIRLYGIAESRKSSATGEAGPLWVATLAEAVAATKSPHDNIAILFAKAGDTEARRLVDQFAAKGGTPPVAIATIDPQTRPDLATLYGIRATPVLLVMAGSGAVVSRQDQTLSDK